MLKKIHYIYNKAYKEQRIENISDVFIRFFLRNISFFQTMNRYNEFEYIQTFPIKDLNLSSFYLPFIEQIKNDLMSPNSLFLDIFFKMSTVPAREASQTCEEIMKRIKFKD